MTEQKAILGISVQRTIFGIPVVEVIDMPNPILVASDWASFIILRDGMTEEILDLDSLRRECMRLWAKREHAGTTIE